MKKLFFMFFALCFLFLCLSANVIGVGVANTFENAESITSGIYSGRILKTGQTNYYVAILKPSQKLDANLTCGQDSAFPAQIIVYDKNKEKITENTTIEHFASISLINAAEEQKYYIAIMPKEGIINSYLLRVNLEGEEAKESNETIVAQETEKNVSGKPAAETTGTKEAMRSIDIFRLARIFVFALLLMAIIAIIIIIMIKRKAKKTQETPKVKAPQELMPIISYIKNAQAQGFSDEQIKDALTKAGWPAEKINNAFSSF